MKKYRNAFVIYVYIMLWIDVTIESNELYCTG